MGALRDATRVAIRADGGIRVGAGHVARCLSLGRGLASHGAHVEFLSAELDQPLRARVLGAGFAVSDLPRSWKRQRDVTCRVLTTFDALIVDHYAVREEDERAFRAKVDHVIALDDRPWRRHAADVLVDATLGRTEQDYADWVAPGTELLLGSAYAPVASEIVARRAEARARRAGAEVRSLLICLGGAAPARAIEQLVEGLVALGAHKRFEIRLVEGMALDAATAERTRALLGESACVAGYVSDMPELLLWADVVIGAAGVSTWERCTLGIPSIVLCLADNQEQIARAVVQAGAALDGGGADIDTQAIVRGLDRLLRDRDLYQEMSERAFQVCDGAGVERTCRAILDRLPRGTP